MEIEIEYERRTVTANRRQHLLIRWETGNREYESLQPFLDARTTTEYGYELTRLWQEDTLLARSINHELTGTITFREVQKMSNINLLAPNSPVHQPIIGK